MFDTKSDLMKSVCWMLMSVVVSVLFNSCYNGKLKNNMEDENKTVIGTARNGKDGALVLTKEDSVYYVDGLEFWEDSINGNEISVTGILKIESLSTNEMKNEKDEWKAGVVGDKKTILGATWKIIKK